MTTLAEALALLQAQARPDQLAKMAGFAMHGDTRLGVSVPALRTLGKRIGRDHGLAQALWDTSMPDAQILASLVADPTAFGVRQMNAWTRGMQAWDVCDQACGNAFLGSPHAWGRVHAWAGAREEYVRRAAFALLATLAVHDRGAADKAFIETLPLIEAAADDDRNFVKKAVNWALRNIGKRNAALNAQAIACAKRLRERDSRAARWIATDALRELQGDAVQARLSRTHAGR
jgi:3-methyladenine DNA glycosylase AlkD